MQFELLLPSCTYESVESRIKTQKQLKNWRKKFRMEAHQESLFTDIEGVHAHI